MSHQPVAVAPQPIKFKSPVQVNYINPQPQPYVSPFELRGQFRNSWFLYFNNQTLIHISQNKRIPLTIFSSNANNLSISKIFASLYLSITCLHLFNRRFLLWIQKVILWINLNNLYITLLSSSTITIDLWPAANNFGFMSSLTFSGLYAIFIPVHHN